MLRLSCLLLLVCATAFAGGVNNPGGSSGGGISSPYNSPITFGFGGSTGGAQDALVFNTNEAGKGKFMFRTNFTPGQNGATRRDNQLGWGYNAPDSPSYVSGDDYFMVNMENSYVTGTGQRQGEMYVAYSNGAGTNGRRMMGWYPRYDSPGSDLITFAVDAVDFGPNENEPGIIVGSSGGSGSTVTGTIGFQGGARGRIDFSGLRFGESSTTTDFITRGTSGLLGVSSSNVSRIAVTEPTTALGCAGTTP
jgi:hypothetical protein